MVHGVNQTTSSDKADTTIHVTTRDFALDVVAVLTGYL